MRIDEQEATRFLLLSPEINKDKIREAIGEKIKKDSDTQAYKDYIESNPDRLLLKERIVAIKQERINGIIIKTPEIIEKRFYGKIKSLKPRHQRDIGRIINIVKVCALLNLWHREREGLNIIANEDDINQAFKIWELIWESQELNLPPYVYDLYKDVIVSVYEAKNSDLDSGVKLGLTRQDILQKHFDIYGRFLPDWQLRQHIIPMLETSGLITQEADSTDRRKILICPTTVLTVSSDKNYSESGSGVDESNA